ncbi:MAG: YggS family pyridoxal phosphate-dependent enzyme [Planctomycetes bacterium]|jgi:pyridoxal phosphate enzyme (YggS family)|nr:YggS family pyridoxal phosphate-dependent enzyme [Planctomycetota bacterium]HON44239.1 YggS family pyridoxal phosphate-dependent enzyme [Planctomycetota bacterium]HPY74350.1 YggS family pyridoxal phosphate-dependent enzyme [Planctomycetota bacterium]HQA99884.1 YggS family pyridoxal phosphate-dependent enzyme [Planctomycetota bacterium]HRU51521.1 YggS family pyridoxal phosphate-dependent enzyme [Planctomycetota bacterium]
MKLQENLRKVQENIARAAEKVGRKAEEVQLIAVTKTMPTDIIQQLYSLGVRCIGENRVFDAGDKKAILTETTDLKWHLIGTLQRKKVTKALKIFDYIHSVDSVLLAEEISKKASKIIPVLLEVNVSGEKTKHGFSIEELEQSMETLLSLPKIKIHGFMTMAPFCNDSTIWRTCFSSLRCLMEKYNTRYADILQMSELSMGMSQDYEVAIQEGATMVRVGSALYEGLQ